MDSVRAMIESSRNLTFDNTLEHTATTLSRKSTATAAVIDTVSMALDAGGGAAYARGSGIDRLFRDVQGARYHPLSTGSPGGLHRPDRTGTRPAGLSPAPTRAVVAACAGGSGARARRSAQTSPTSSPTQRTMNGVIRLAQ